MPEVTIDARVPDMTAGEVYQRLRAFEKYPHYTDTVREVLVRPLDESTVEARWSVNFRNGVLCWTERDTFDEAAGTIAFTQVDGDFEHFGGVWTVRQEGGDTTVGFACSFDLGMPSLAAIIDPIACDALVENIELILRGLLGAAISFEEPGEPEKLGEPAADLLRCPLEVAS